MNTRHQPRRMLRRTAQSPPRRADERGVGAIELLMLAPVLIGCVLVVDGAGRYVEARGQVNAAAHEAARAASLQRDTALSGQAGRDAATRSLSSRGKSCAQLDVDVDVNSYRPGGRVQATVTCTADLSDVLVAGFPGSKTFQARAMVPIEQYRGKADGFTNSDGFSGGNSGEGP